MSTLKKRTSQSMSIFIRALFAVLLMSPVLAWSIDLQPNDVVAPRPDKNFFTISYFGTKNSVPVKSGSGSLDTQNQSSGINLNSAVARVARSYEIAGLPAVAYVQLPYGTVQPTGMLSVYPSGTGVGDLTFATAIWPYSNRETRTYFAVAGYLTAPTGSYSNELPFNYGENRYKWDVQIAFQKPIIGSLDGMIAVDTMWYGANNQCGAACASPVNATLSQKPLTTLQLGPVYKINDTFTVGASYFYVAGGGSSINGRDQDNAVNNQRFLLSAQAYTSIGRFTLQYGRDMSSSNGFSQDRLLALRYLTQF